MNENSLPVGTENAAAAEVAPQKRKHIALKRTVGIFSVLVFIGLMVWATLRVGMPLLEQLFGGAKVTEEGTLAFREMVAENPIRGRLIYIGIQILQVFVALIPGEVVEVAGGVAFGPLEGLALSLLGVVIGSSIVFMLTKTLGIRFVELFVDRKKIDELAFIRSNNRLNSLVFLVFFIPGTPKDVLTYIVGLTRMKLHTFLLISAIARIPSILTSTWGGDALIKGDYKKAILIFGVTAVVSAVGLIVYNKLSKKWKEKKEAKSCTE